MFSLWGVSERSRFVMFSLWGVSERSRFVMFSFGVFLKDLAL